MHACACGEGATCHHVTGDCLCPPGRVGPTCEQGKRELQGEKSRAGTHFPVPTPLLPSWTLLPACPPPSLGPTGCQEQRYGEGCQQTCSCQNRGLCNATDGSCSCGLGWTGKSCELGNPALQAWSCASWEALSWLSTWLCVPAGPPEPPRCPPAACPPGRYGADCQLHCSCRHNATCDPTTGACRCPPGHYGPLCEHGELRRGT